MIFEARSSSRRWTTVTELAKRVRKVASSIAVSPPPTTTIALSLKKKPSQVAQAETPKPMSSRSAGRPSRLGGGAGGDDQRVAGDLAVLGGGDAERPLRQVDRRDLVEQQRRCRSAPPGCGTRSISSGPRIPSGKPGKFSTSVVIVSWPPGCMPSMTTGVSSGARRVERGGEAGRAGAEDEDSGVTLGHGAVPSETENVPAAAPRFRAARRRPFYLARSSAARRPRRPRKTTTSPTPTARAATASSAKPQPTSAGAWASDESTNGTPAAARSRTRSGAG